MFGSGDLKNVGFAMWFVLSLFPLGIWKLVELIIWLIKHIKIVG